MYRRKLLVILGSALLLVCLLAFTGASSPHASAASAKSSVASASVSTTGASVATDPKLMAYSATSCPPTLRYGSSGYWVRSLQSSLNYYYYYGYFYNYPYNFKPYLAVDGAFGPLTWNAVYDFQYWQGLQRDGIVGPQTWHALGYC